MIKNLTLMLSVATVFSSGVMASDIYENAQNIVGLFEKKFGITKGKRRNHTKGFCFEGSLIPVNKNIRQYSTSPIFNDASKVIGRLSHKGGSHDVSDDKPAEYGMGIEITTASGDVHNMAMNTLDFFPVATPEAFAELMLAKATSKEAIIKFKEKNKDLQRFNAHMAEKDKTLTPYEGASYNSINSFYLIGKKGQKHAVRWTFVPTQEQHIVLEPKANFFFANLQENLNTHTVSWNMLVTFSNAEDDINNPAIRWEGERKQMIAAKLDIHSISTEEEGKCDSINYDPLVVSEGFEPSEDPMLEARSIAYAISFSKRMNEKKGK